MSNKIFNQHYTYDNEQNSENYRIWYVTINGREIKFYGTYASFLEHLQSTYHISPSHISDFVNTDIQSLNSHN